MKIARNAKLNCNRTYITHRIDRNFITHLLVICLWLVASKQTIACPTKNLYVSNLKHHLSYEPLQLASSDTEIDLAVRVAFLQDSLLITLLNNSIANLCSMPDSIWMLALTSNTAGINQPSKSVIVKDARVKHYLDQVAKLELQQIKILDSLLLKYKLTEITDRQLNALFDEFNLQAHVTISDVGNEHLQTLCANLTSQFFMQLSTYHAIRVAAKNPAVFSTAIFSTYGFHFGRSMEDVFNYYKFSQLQISEPKTFVRSIEYK
jgi:hypothetical protein